MGKNKKKKTKLIRHPHVIPKDYLIGVSDRLHGMNPSKPIVLNTITDVWKEGYNDGYQRRQDEITRFKQKQKDGLEKDFKIFMDELDD